MTTKTLFVFSFVVLAGFACSKKTAADREVAGSVSQLQVGSAGTAAAPVAEPRASNCDCKPDEVCEEQPMPLPTAEVGDCPAPPPGPGGKCPFMRVLAPACGGCVTEQCADVCAQKGPRTLGISTKCV